MTPKETSEKSTLEFATFQNGVQVLTDLAFRSFKMISSHQLRNGLIPASVGRFDDEHFTNNMVWVKDHSRASRFPLDPLVQQSLPELSEKGKNLYLRATRGILRVQSQPEQRPRFKARPEKPDEEGYSTIDDDQKTPAIKFTQEGYIYYDWGHNQPDNWGTLMLNTGRGIEADWPVLRKIRNGFVPGEVLQDIISYTVNLNTERFKCRSIWEHERVPSSYSTKRIILAGISQIDKIWPELVRDSKTHGYILAVSRDKLQQAAGNLEDSIKGYVGDITDTPQRHKSIADLASLVVVNDVDNLPLAEQEAILGRIREAELENRQGFFRYYGDHWKHGWAEAKWTMGKPIMARHLFKKAIASYRSKQIDAAFRALDHGMDRVNDIINVLRDHGYYPELFEDEDRDGVFKPNNNELAWTNSYIIEAAAAGIAAIETSRKYSLKKAA